MKKKERIITFKTDEELAEQLDKIPNKSEFIRRAVQGALEQKCPLCNGAGVLSQEQQQHLEQFLSFHSIEKCGECKAIHFACHDGCINELH